MGVTTKMEVYFFKNGSLFYENGSLFFRKWQFVLRKWEGCFFFIGCFKFAIKQRFPAYQDQFVLCLVSLDCQLRLLENFFWVIFLNKQLYFSSSCFLNLFNALARLFYTLSFAQSHKILSEFSKLSAILKHRGKNFVMMTSIVHLSSNRSQTRTNQNAKITQVIV